MYNCPSYPRGTPNSPAFSPHTSTPLPPGQVKLSQRAAHFRGPFAPISSRLADTAPALIWDSASGFPEQPGCSSVSMPISLYRWQHCSAVLLLCCSFVWDSCHMSPNCHGSLLGTELGGTANLRELSHSFWFLPLGLKGHTVDLYYLNKC